MDRGFIYFCIFQPERELDNLCQGSCCQTVMQSYVIYWTVRFLTSYLAPSVARLVVQFIIRSSHIYTSLNGRSFIQLSNHSECIQKSIIPFVFVCCSYNHHKDVNKNVTDFKTEKQPFCTLCTCVLYFFCVFHKTSYKRR